MTNVIKFSDYRKSISKANKNSIETRRLSQKPTIFAIGLRQLSPTHTRKKKKKKRYAYLASRTRRKFQTWHKRQHSGSHSIAWAAVIIYAPKVSFDLQLRRGSIAVPRFGILKPPAKGLAGIEQDNVYGTTILSKLRHAPYRRQQRYQCRWWP